MIRTRQAVIRDNRAAEILATRWTLDSALDRAAVAEQTLSSVKPMPGLLRFSVFGGVDESTLLGILQCSDVADSAARNELGAEVRRYLPTVAPDWQDWARPYVSWHPKAGPDFGCLVVVRQPLKQADPKVQRAWVDTVMSALASDAEPNPDLNAATFFLATDNIHILNLAEWSSAEAHRAALRRNSIGQHGSIGSSPQWQATRAHPGITPEHEIGRYAFIDAVTEFVTDPMAVLARIDPPES